MGAIGYLFAMISVLAFGSNFVVTKKFKTGDGMVFQWVLASGIFLFGLFFYIGQCHTVCELVGSMPSCSAAPDSHTCPPISSFAMLGGALWAAGNVLTVPIIKTLGLSLGMLTWGMANMLVGWGSARFGLLGQPKGVVANHTLNYVGVLTAVVAMGVFAFVRPTVGKAARAAAFDGEHDAAYSKLMAGEGGGAYASSLTGGIDERADADAAADDDADEPSWTDALSAPQKMIFGFAASVAAGCLYGVNFNPPGYVASHACAAAYPGGPPATCKYPGMSTDVKDYVFSHFIGIWLMSTCMLIAYCVATRNAPKVYADSLLPAVVSGLIWASAQVSWFFANSFLGNVIAFPIISIGPGLVSAIWGIFVFGELKGTKNFALVGGAFVLIAAASTMMALSA